MRLAALAATSRTLPRVAARDYRAALHARLVEAAHLGPDGPAAAGPDLVATLVTLRSR